ncbi:MAG TPA: PaaX family transcriptional regulator C-terminal domain-containing protein [Segeticoccus sp.]|uniref:PaaX family transcriptional regulator n=1 Tax=Segeticoccus sp. TaxID=2706531 RepID=UPI002D806533|nr:PaaX family transcriptional regulator C-terminal domain-containing protein [Segeticoccus sp.]HET8599889.1 PaaX family transcriptional regulator C-terminal domain-containing protein [Segeticoccus sp.]
MHARAAVFDLYGDHLADRGSWAPIAGIVRLLGTVEVAPPAVRTAVSRLVREGWLEPAERDGQRGYAATERARDRLAEARSRIYRTGSPEWDGRWHLVVTERGAGRAARARSVAALSYLGYARLAADTWIAPRASAELAATLRAEGMASRQFHARFADDPRALAAGLWDLDTLGTAYARFLARACRLREQLPSEIPADRAFANRTTLVHEWRKFLFDDPGLPREVLPQGWPGQEAAEVFDRLAADLLPLARRFVDECLGDTDHHPTDPAPTTSRS